MNLVGSPGDTADVETAKNAKTPFPRNRKNLQLGLIYGVSFQIPPVKVYCNLSGAKSDIYIRSLTAYGNLPAPTRASIRPAGRVRPDSKPIPPHRNSVALKRGPVIYFVKSYCKFNLRPGRNGRRRYREKRDRAIIRNYKKPTVRFSKEILSIYPFVDSYRKFNRRTGRNDRHRNRESANPRRPKKSHRINNGNIFRSPLLKPAVITGSRNREATCVFLPTTESAP